jgi:flavin reductase (DIM6/NTAB) family NADH-FMN oxidoreductase RutF
MSILTDDAVSMPSTREMIRIDPERLSWAEQYKLLGGTVIPRPIALVSTLGPCGPNAAPFSFFNAIAVDPMMLMFSIGPTVGSKKGTDKDTLTNLRVVPEFVVHIVDDAAKEKMNICSAEHPHGINEMALAGFRTEPSCVVQPPRIVDCPVQFECKVTQILTLGRTPYNMVIGEVVYAHYRQGIIDERLHVDVDRLNPIGRLAGNGVYTRVTDRFTMLPPPAPSTATS